jgi:hypothetical protein
VKRETIDLPRHEGSKEDPDIGRAEHVRGASILDNARRMLLVSGAYLRADSQGSGSD